MIKKQGNVILLGTSHISKQSVKNLRETFKVENPDIVAIELDPPRLRALSEKKKGGVPNPFRVGFKGMLFGILGQWAEKKMGKYVGVSPGTEMLTAARLAKRNKKTLAFIDQNIEITLKRFSQALSWTERWNFVKDVFKGLLGIGPKIEFNLSDVPDDEIITKLLSQTKDRYPNIHKVLVEERNMFMAKKLRLLSDNFPDKKILAIVGAGHVEAILELIKESPQGYSFSWQTITKL